MSGHQDIVAALVGALAPRIRQVVREEVASAKLEWRWRTPEQVGELFGISADAVRQRIYRGQLAASKLDGRLFVDLRALDSQLRLSRYDGPPPEGDNHKMGRAAASTAPGPGHRR
jgi:hypothetical protein